MNTVRGWFVLFGVVICVLLGALAYVVLSNHPGGLPAQASSGEVVYDPATRYVPEATPAATATPAPRTPQAGPDATPTYLYNVRGQLQSITYPDGSVYAYEYNAQGDKIRETSRTGKTWSYIYDQNHHPLSIIDPEGRIVHHE